MFLGPALQLALALAVIDRMIWLRARRHPQPNDRPMFGTVSTGLGGGDFWSAALVVVIGVISQQVALAWAGSGTAVTLTNGETLSALSPGQAWLIQGVKLAATWGVIAWRNRPLLDWRWSAAAALLICGIPLVFVTLMAIVGSL